MNPPDIDIKVQMTIKNTNRMITLQLMTMKKNSVGIQCVVVVEWVQYFW